MRNYIYIVLLVLLVGCNSDRPSKPDNLISKDEMSEIIYDVFLLNAAKGVNKKILENNGIFPQDYIFKKYKIDSLQFALSNEYYAYNIDIYESIMAKVKLKIEFEKRKNDSINTKEDRTKDSVRSQRMKTPDTLKKLKIRAKIDTLPVPKQKLEPKVFGQDND